LLNPRMKQISITSGALARNFPIICVGGSAGTLFAAIWIASILRIQRR